MWINNLGDIYYLKNYPFTVSLMYTDNDDHVVLSTVEVDAGNTSPVYFDITPEQYDAINYEYFWPYIRLTDCTTLRHMIGPSRHWPSFHDEKLEIEWQTNGGFWCIKPFVDNETLDQQDIVFYDNAEKVNDQRNRQLYITNSETFKIYYLNYNIKSNDYWSSPTNTKSILKKKKSDGGYYTFKGWAVQPDGNPMPTNTIEPLVQDTPITWYAIWSE